MKKIFSLIFLGIFMIGLLGLTACKKAEFPDSLKSVLNSEIEQHKNEIYWNGGSLEERAFKRIRLLEKYRKKEPLKTWLSYFAEIRLIEIEGKYNDDDEFYAALILHKGDIRIVEYSLNEWVYDVHAMSKEDLWDLCKDRWLVANVLEELANLSKEDIDRIIEEKVRAH